MKKITVASYYSSGSSAVTDLLTEFKNVKSLTSFEFRFAHDPDGLSELEYNVVDNFNRHNSGHALKRYQRLVNYYSYHLLTHRYERFFNGKWKKLSDQYINELTDFSYPGTWQYDFYDKGKWYEFWHKLPNRILHYTIWRNKPDNSCFFNHETTLATHPSEERFLDCTRRYTEALMKAANPENKTYLLLDQLVPSTNIERHMRYFENLKVIVVDRDPRDIFIQAKYQWHDKIVPSDVEIFCKWYRYTRSTRNTEHWNEEKIMLIQFEDLIYHYDETLKKIMHWTGLKCTDHIHPKNCFNPDKSVKNTRCWINHPEYAQEMAYIEKELPEFLYHTDNKQS